MDQNERETAVNPEEEFKRLRVKTGQEELTELKRGLLGGYKKKDVASYVERLKDQLATTEKTYKAHIAELLQEKDQLRFERDALQARIKQMETEPASTELQTALRQAKQAAEGFLADRGSLEEKLKYMTRMSDEAVTDLQARVDALQAELVQARDRNEALVYEADAAREEQRDAFEKELAALSAEKEGLQVQREALSARASQTEAWLRCELQEALAKLEAAHALAAEADSRVEEAARQLEGLAQENTSLTAQVQTARQNITALMKDKEAVEGINDQLRKALNSLVVKAEAVVKENGVVGTLLEAERDRVQRYQAVNGRLSDMLARVRTANQLLEERVADLDRALSQDGGQPGKAGQTVSSRMMADPLDFVSPNRNPLKDIVAELNSIQANLAQYQLPGRPSDEREKKSNIRYSVEKLEVDCPSAKPESDWAEPESLVPPAAGAREQQDEEVLPQAE